MRLSTRRDRGADRKAKHLPDATDGQTKPVDSIPAKTKRDSSATMPGFRLLLLHAASLCWRSSFAYRFDDSLLRTNKESSAGRVFTHKEPATV